MPRVPPRRSSARRDTRQVFGGGTSVRNDADVDLPDQSPQVGPSDQSRIRASDADRDRIADQLREALAEGRLTPEEHAERIDRVYSAKTYAELAPIVDDLPGQGPPTPSGGPASPSVQVNQGADLPAPTHQSTNMVAVFGGAERKGRWLVEPHTNVLAVFGGVELDFRQAVLSQREVTVNITCLFGGVDIKVPPGVRVIESGAAIFGDRSLPGDDPTDPNAPVIRLTGMTVFGGVDVKRKPNTDGLSRRDRRDQRRMIREQMRTARREIRWNRRGR
jgi:uncharacterized protein DUF1707/cell wall-active antibiotic response 4TMS protein YvqF